MTTLTGPKAAAPNIGFVVAMRALPCGARSAEAAEWLIVARWAQGELLSVSWTDGKAAASEAPLDLTPRRTVIGMSDRAGLSAGATSFRLLATLPETVTVAGLFVPAAGTARLSGRNSAIRLHFEGHALGTACAWNLVAERGGWIGEFV